VDIELLSHQKNATYGYLRMFFSKIIIPNFFITHLILTNMKSFILSILSVIYLFKLLLRVHSFAEVSSSNDISPLQLVKRGGTCSGCSKESNDSGNPDPPTLTRVRSRHWGHEHETIWPNSDSESLSWQTQKRVKRNRPWSGSSYETNSGESLYHKSSSFSDSDGSIGSKSAKSVQSEATSKRISIKGKEKAEPSHYGNNNEVGVTGDLPGARNRWDKGSLVTAQDGSGPRYIHIKKPLKHRGNNDEVQLYAGTDTRKNNPERKTKVWKIKSNNGAHLFTGRRNKYPFDDPKNPVKKLKPYEIPEGKTEEDAVRQENRWKLSQDLRLRQDHVFKKKRRASETHEEYLTRKRSKKPPSPIKVEH